MVLLGFSGLTWVSVGFSRLSQVLSNFRIPKRKQISPNKAPIFIRIAPLLIDEILPLRATLFYHIFSILSTSWLLCSTSLQQVDSG